MVCLVVCSVALCTGGLLFLFYRLHPLAGCVLEAVMTYQILATKCLKVESMKVYERLSAGDLSGARQAVSMIVGRDTERLDEIGVAKAAIETVAENTSDGVIAPMLYLAIGGPLLGFVYKAINTMDSMVGYKNQSYLFFGRCAAKLDDVVNYLPARISALLMILGSFLPGNAFDGKGAWRIWRRDSRNHASPNSAQTEAACAGSLGIQLAGNASYFGKIVEKPTIGDDDRPVEDTDIVQANRLLYRTAFLCMGICVALLWIVVMLARL
jgi:adenosylcobinamide-phosphate synthase